jgi:hypothetical protein
VDTAGRVITVDRKVVEVGGHLFVEAPKNRKYRKTIYPRLTPAGYPLAERLAARVEEARAEQAAGTNPLGLVFPSPMGKHWRSSNFRRNVLGRAYQAAGWRDADGQGPWTWHSLRHVFCTTALFTWKLDATDVSRMAGHANYRITLDMYVGTTPASSTAPAPPPSNHELGAKALVSETLRVFGRNCVKPAPVTACDQGLKWPEAPGRRAVRIESRTSMATTEASSSNNSRSAASGQVGRVMAPMMTAPGRAFPHLCAVGRSHSGSQNRTQPHWPWPDG